MATIISIRHSLVINRIDFKAVNPCLTTGMDFMIHPCRWIYDEENLFLLHQIEGGIVSVLHQKQGGIGKSIPDTR